MSILDTCADLEKKEDERGKKLVELAKGHSVEEFNSIVTQGVEKDALLEAFQVMNNEYLEKTIVLIDAGMEPNKAFEDFNLVSQAIQGELEKALTERNSKTITNKIKNFLGFGV